MFIYSQFEYKITTTKINLENQDKKVKYKYHVTKFRMTKIRFVRLNIACAFVCMHIHSFNVNANCLSLFRSFVLFSFGSGSSSVTFDFRSMIFQSIGVCVFFFRCLRLLPMVQVFGRKYAFQCILIRIYLCVWMCLYVPICAYMCILCMCVSSHIVPLLQIHSVTVS